ncbi:MAG: hypothetical protein HKM93_01585 [Desulfobacteraceae bacterium]|nr:hypothetical protein [Desulfobacteraceae bacterium]
MTHGYPAGTINRISKLSPPSLPDIVDRNRLFKILKDKHHFQISWISGMAGSGKTTLAASFLNISKIPNIWYRMDPGDEDSSVFFHYLVQSLETAVGDKIELSLPKPDYQYGITVFSQRFFELLSLHLPSPFYIVFDNYHELPLDSEFHEIFNACMDGLGGNVHVIVLSRLDPPPQLAGLTANNRLRLISSDRLAFTRKELLELTNKKSAVSIHPDLAKKIYDRSMGWAAGIILLLRSVDAGIIRGNNLGESLPEDIFNYFLTELFQISNLQTQLFLVKTAVLSQVTLEIAEALTGDLNSEAIFQELRTKRYFIESYTEHDSIFQYHPLFRDFLIRQGRSMLSEEEITHLRLKAAAIYEACGMIEEAANLHHEAKQTTELARLILEQAFLLMVQARHKTLEKWLGWLPDQYIHKNPWLLFWSGSCRYPWDHATSEKYFRKAFELFGANQDMTGQLLSWSGQVGCIFFEFESYKTFQPLLDWFDEHVGPDYDYPTPEIETQVVISYFSILGALYPGHPKIRYWLDRVWSIIQEKRDMESLTPVYMSIVLLHYYMGEFDLARLCAQKLDQVAADHQNLPSWNVTQALVRAYISLWIEVDIDTAVNELNQSLRLAERSGFQTHSQFLLNLASFLFMISDSPSLAKKFFNRMKKTITGRNKFLHLYYQALSTRYLIEKERENAVRHAFLSLDMANKSGIRFLQIVCTVTHALALVEDQQVKASKAQIQQALRMSREVKSPLLTYASQMAGAYIYVNDQKEKKGLSFLKRALKSANKHNYILIPWWWHPRMYSRLCAEALDHGIEPDYVKKMIYKLRLTPSDEAHIPTNWPFLIEIRVFGGFCMTKNGEPIRISGKVNQKRLNMLKVIIASGGTDIRKERIIDALWPDADGDLAANSFSTTLNRLREFMGNKELIRLTEGKISLNRKYCRVDALEFHRYLSEYKAANRGSDKGNSGMITEKIIDLYKGPFLADEQWSPEILFAREKFKKQYLHILLQSGKALENKKNFREALARYQTGLRTDDLEEEFYRRIMYCHSRLGDLAEIKRIYHTCESVLKQKLNATLSTKTRDLYRKIT